MEQNHVSQPPTECADINGGTIKADAYGNFQKEVEHLINKYSIENDSDTPDYILAIYLRQCLDLYIQTVIARDKWHNQQK